MEQALLDYSKDHKDQLYRLLFHAVFEANPKIFMEVLDMGKLQLDREAEELFDKLVREI